MQKRNHQNSDMETFKISRQQECKESSENGLDYGSQFIQVWAHGFLLMNFGFFDFQKSRIFTQKHTSLGSLKVFLCVLVCLVDLVFV